MAAGRAAARGISTGRRSAGPRSLALRVGVVGCGFIANVHSWALWAVRKAGLFDVNIVAVCDRDGDRAATLARPNDAEVLSLDALLDAVDAVYVCTPTAE